MSAFDPLRTLGAACRILIMAKPDEARWEKRLKKVAKHKREPNSPEHKEIGDETKNPLPDHDYSQKQPSDGGNEMTAGDGDPGNR